MMPRIFLACCFLSLCAKVTAQKDTSKSIFTYSGYLEGYYCYDASEPRSGQRQNFIYSHNIQNEPNLNLGFIKVSWTKGDYRSNLAFMMGTYALANLVAEEPRVRNIFEANFGFKISPKYNVWVDAGIMPSHIGFESAVSKDCWTATRSILADNSPYYESGLKLSSSTEKWTLSALLLNGWQHIWTPDIRHSPALGHQVLFKPNDNITLNSSSFIGRETSDSSPKLRTCIFHNFYAQFQPHKKWGLILGFDIGAQQKPWVDDEYNTWYSPVAILRFIPRKQFMIAARAEWYNDPDQVIIKTGTPNGFNCRSYSLNLDYLLKKNILLRIEQRRFISKVPMFNSSLKTSSAFTASMSLSF